MAKTKIVVIQMKELIYTAIFAGLGILLIVLLIVMFAPSGKDKKASNAGQAAENGIYTPGVYNSQVVLGDSTLNLEVVVDSNQIKSVSFVNLEESVTTMYPLIKPSMENIEKELVNGTAIDDVPLSEKSKYTESLLLEGVRSALSKALPDA